MRTVNKVILIGNITKDPLIKTTESGKKVAIFTIATNRYYKNSAWENQSEAEFNNCIAWGTLAERIETFVKKGKLVYVEGRLKTRKIEREEGDTLYKTEIVISSIIFLSKRSDSDESISKDELDSIDSDIF